ncbi:hypothetical protein TNCV_4381471 [Trichonephila clavipes]|nr:hypothetical protein TNCV_4381471 [Trichonephila clavipes]
MKKVKALTQDYEEECQKRSNLQSDFTNQLSEISKLKTKEKQLLQDINDLLESKKNIEDDLNKMKIQAGCQVVLTESPLDPQKAKNIVSTYIDKCTDLTPKTESLGKPWEALAIVGPIPRHMKRAGAVAHFPLTTGHDFLYTLQSSIPPLAWPSC